VDSVVQWCADVCGQCGADRVHSVQTCVDRVHSVQTCADSVHSVAHARPCWWVPDASKKTGYRLTGDVDFDEALKVCGKITPVPGGVGPMTIAMLLSNTLDSAKRFIVK
jgi:hypothetical protein